MKCENNFCVYQHEDKCILDEISVDSLGMCEECIYPDIDEKILNKAKMKLLKEYKNKNYN